MMVRVPFESCHDPLTAEELKELEEATKRPIVYDEDCPKLTKEQLKQFKRVTPHKYHTA